MHATISAPALAAPASRGSVLVVDHEPTIARVVARYLEHAGYATEIAHDGALAVDVAAALRPDLVVLDMKLPRMDGLEVMRRLRAEARGRPAVIIVSGRAEESDRILGLRLGADDYVMKPFSPAELVARVDAVLRRIEPVPEHQAPVRFDGLEIDPSGRRVALDGKPLELTVREFELLLFLARHPGQAFTRDQLMERVWQYTFYLDTSTVTVHIRRLRSKLEPDPARPRFIHTVWGVGYRFDP